MFRLSLLWTLKSLHKLDIHIPRYLKSFGDKNKIICEHCVGYSCWIMISTSSLIRFESNFLFSPLYCFTDRIIQHRTHRYVARMLPWITSDTVSRKPVFLSNLKTCLLLFWYFKLNELINFTRLSYAWNMYRIQSQWILSNTFLKSTSVSITVRLFDLTPIIILSTGI